MALFDIFKQGLTKTRDFLTQGMNKITASMGYYDENMLDELEELLVQADLGVACVDSLMDRVRADMKAYKDNSEIRVLASLREGMSELLGEEQHLLLKKDGLTIVLMIGVNGTGKTTTCGKLAARYKAEGKKVLLAAADTFRAAAIDQLKHWAEQTGCDCIAQQEGSDPAAVLYDAIQAAHARKVDVLLVDTAGRLHNKKNLMDELAKLRRIIDREARNAHVESLLVLDATTGQNAVIQAKLFHETAQLTGLILTKLDGNSKGGVAVSVASQTKLPIYLVGLGERVEDLADFSCEDFIASLLPKKDHE